MATRWKPLPSLPPLSPPPPFKAQLRVPLPESPPFLGPEALKPAPAGRPALGPSVEGRASLYLGPRKVREPHGAEGAAAGGVLLPLKDQPGATSPKASSVLSTLPGERGGASLGYLESLGVGWGAGHPDPTCHPAEPCLRPHRCPDTLTRPYVRSRTRSWSTHPSIHLQGPRGRLWAELG